MFKKILLAFLLLSASSLGAGKWKFDQMIQQPLHFSESRTWQIRPGQGLILTLNELEKAGVIKDAKWLALYYRLKPQKSLKQGKYQIPAQINDIEQLMALFEKGQVIQYTITFVEGLTVKQFRQQLKELDKVEQLTANWTEQKILNELNDYNIF